jgi:type I restriction enzyme M protein
METIGLLVKTASEELEHPVFNTSKYTLKKLLEDADNIACNLVDYIQGFSPKTKEVFEKFKFEEEITNEEAGNHFIPREVRPVRLMLDTKL